MRTLWSAVPIALVAALGVASAGTPADFRLTRISETDHTVTLAWKRQPGAIGYVFLRNGVVVARTFDRSTTRATFWKASKYAVQTLDRDSAGRLRPGVRATLIVSRPRSAPKVRRARLVLVPGQRPRFGLDVVSQTSRMVTFRWRRQPGIDGYRFVRNGVVVSQTFERSTTTATFWKGSWYAVDALRLRPDRRVIYSERAIARTMRREVTHATFVFRSAPRVEFKLRVVARTPTTITFRWKRQPGIDGYRFVRNGAVVSKTFDRSTTTATFWKGSRYAVAAVRMTMRKEPATVMRALAYVPGATGSTKVGGVAQAPSPGSGTSAPPPSSGSAQPAPPRSNPSPPPPPSPPTPAPPTGFPGASNTGVPAGTTLSPYTGPSNITTADTVIDGKSIGCIQVSAPGVVIRNSRITCNDDWGVFANGMSGTPLLVEDSEIDCQNSNATGAGSANMTLTRVNIHSCENGLHVNHDITVEDSYIHDLYIGGGAHADGMQFGQASNNVTIRHNTIFSMGESGGFGTSALIMDLPGHSNFLIENNLFGGGGFTVYCVDPGSGTSWIIRNNAFTTRFSPTGGEYGFAIRCSDETQSGNYIYETGKPLHLD